MTTAEKAINQQLHCYFDGLYFSATTLLQSVFHVNANYITASSGELIRLSMPEYFSIVKKRTAPADKNQPRQDKIISIDVIGENTALAKVTCFIAPKHFIDLLNFIKVDGRWQIISKVFHYEIFHYEIKDGSTSESKPESKSVPPT